VKEEDVTYPDPDDAANAKRGSTHELMLHWRDQAHRWRWIARRYERFAAWHSYIPTVTELEREYEEQKQQPPAKPPEPPLTTIKGA
jgi:murein L,D-transpeptidase YafK